MTHTAIISLGSNLPCATQIVEATAEVLEDVVDIEASSGVFVNPDDTGRGDDYANAVLRVRTHLSEERFMQVAREFEQAAGRTPELKASGVVPLDIDLVIWDGRVVSEHDRVRPYFIHGYSLISE